MKLPSTTYKERFIFNQMIDTTVDLMENDMEDVDDQSSVSSTDSFDMMDFGFFIDPITLSMITDDIMPDDSSSSDDYLSSDESSICFMSNEIIEYYQTTFVPSESSSFTTQNEIIIADLPNNETTRDEFRFRKDHLQIMADEIWRRFSGLFFGPKEKNELPQRTYIHYETGLLLCLYRLACPKRIDPDIESIQDFLNNQSIYESIL